MNKKELIQRVAEHSGLSKKVSATALEAMMQVMRNSFSQGETIRIHELGTFSVRQHSARNGFNPMTKQPMLIKAYKTVRFTPSKRVSVE